MRLHKLLILGLLLSGCTTLSGAPATINSPLDWALAYIESNTDQNRYYIKGEITRILEVMEAEGAAFAKPIEHAQKWYTPLRTASELQQKYLELKEALHQYYLVSGKYR